MEGEDLIISDLTKNIKNGLCGCWLLSSFAFK